MEGKSQTCMERDVPGFGGAGEGGQSPTCLFALNGPKVRRPTG